MAQLLEITAFFFDSTYLNLLLKSVLMPIRTYFGENEEYFQQDRALARHYRNVKVYLDGKL